MQRLGFIGGGNMAEAIVRAAIDRGVVAPQDIVVSDPSEARRNAMASNGVRVTASNADVVASVEQIVLAVKPQAAAEPAGEVGAALRDDQIVISIMAGLSTAKLAALIRAGMPGGGEERRVRLVRVMPNTPVMAGQGMSGVALGGEAEAGDDALALAIMSAGGSAIRVDESQLDAITAVSGSGPAYSFFLAEAMQRAATELGLGEHASTLVTQTLLGAARLLDESADDAAALRKKVTSPGGTTEAAIRSLEDAGVADAVVAAIRAAEARSRELGA